MAITEIERQINEPMRMTKEEYNALMLKRKPEPMSKYRNVKKEVNGLVFDSVKECRRHQDLIIQQSAGQISELERQRPFYIEVNGHAIGFYVSDFCYKRDGKLVVEDVKSKVTRKLPLYIWKKKLVAAIHGIEIQEI